MKQSSEGLHEVDLIFMLRIYKSKPRHVPGEKIDFALLKLTCYVDENMQFQEFSFTQDVPISTPLREIDLKKEHFGGEQVFLPENFVNAFKEAVYSSETIRTGINLSGINYRVQILCFVFIEFSNFWGLWKEPFCRKHLEKFNEKKQKILFYLADEIR